MPGAEIIVRWLRATTVSWAVAGGIPWIWPLLETLHFIGMAMLFGVVSVLDLRMMGFAKGMPIGPLQRMMPWAIAGFVINLVTGVLFFIGTPARYIHNISFGMKLMCLGLAGINVIVFYVTGLYRRVDPVGADQDAPPAARLAGAVSLFLWLSVMYWGRMLPFIGRAY